MVWLPFHNNPGDHTATVCLISLVIWEWYQKAPIIDVRMFRSFNFASANLMMFTLGILLFSSLVLMPQFLQTLLGYTSRSWRVWRFPAGGLVLLIEMPIMGQLTTKIPARYLIAFGWLCFVAPCSIPRHGLICRSVSMPRFCSAHHSGDRFGVPVRADYSGLLHWDFA